MGTALLLFFGAPSCLGRDWNNTSAPQLVSISLAFGLTVASVVWCIGHASGGHINPAVSISLAICRRVSLPRAIFYVVAQLVGAIAGVALLYGSFACCLFVFFCMFFCCFFMLCLFVVYFGPLCFDVVFIIIPATPPLLKHLHELTNTGKHIHNQPNFSN